MGERLKAAVQRWRKWREQRRIEALERQNYARENLRDFKKSTGMEGGGPPAGLLG